ncbi:penicillin-binding protein 1C [Robbsia sp. KACC 23696]|uniref:penicillin-binding protein 1C n=1 Tax=Robbsia sp. KACC 23696 TaxID=3149231 RepID=UPI00325B8B6B
MTRQGLASAVMLACVLGAVPVRAMALPTFDAVRETWRSADWILLARDGTPLQRTRVDFTARRGDWVALADVSPALLQAILVSEDRRFYEHSGVDWRGAVGAAWANLWNTRTRGASTVTMQLAGLLDGQRDGPRDDGRRPSGRRSWSGKADQAWEALQLERGWRKDQILEAYLNLLPFRGEIIGLDGLSRTLFGKAASGLDAPEAAIAAALVRAPNAAPARVRTRACSILKDMDADADCAVLDGNAALATRGVTQVSRVAADDGTGVAGRNTNPGLAPHFARRIATEVHPVAGARVRSTLDAPLQRFARDMLQRALTELNGPRQNRNVADGAVLVIDNASGEVRAWVGSSGVLSAAPDVDAVTALRQAGSTLKPFLYAQAIDEGRLNAASLLDDAPLDLAAGGGLYIPQNYDKHFKGWVSVRSALASSLNVPAVRTLVLVTPNRFANTLKGLGLPLTEEGDFYGYSLALGSADVSLLTLTNAYRALANGGRVSTVRDQPPALNTSSNTAMQRAETAARGPVPNAKVSASGVSNEAPGKRIFSPAATYIVTDILADNNARVRTFGLDSVLNTRGFSAVKTGTSKDMRDNWAVGFTSRYTIGVWVGNANGSAMWNVSGVTGAAPVWAALVAYLERRGTSIAPKAPADVEHRWITYAPGIEPSRNEWFVRGTGVDTIRLSAAALADTAGHSMPGGTRHTSIEVGSARDAGASPPPPSAGASAPLLISAPPDGTIFALDPDIPPLNQRIWFEQGNAAAARATWRLDGRVIGRGSRLAWSPWPGRHRLELLDARGRVADTIAFEVRGAFARTPQASVSSIGQTR